MPFVLRYKIKGGVKVKIIDLHTHCNCGSKFDIAENEFHKRNFPFLMKEYENCGISAGGFSYYSALFSNEEIFEGNSLLHEQAINDDRVYQWLVLDPRQESLFEQIRTLIKSNKTLGIKIHSLPGCHNYDINEYADKIFSFANELHCFVLMHPDKIVDMVQYADRYPNMKLIIAHLCGMEHIEAIEQAKNANIFTDTSGGASNANNVIEYAIERIGSEKIFFGTDTYSCAFQTGRIKYARISEKDKENIFYNNAKLHFKKQFESI